MDPKMEDIFEILCDYTDKKCSFAQAKARLMDIGFDEDEIDDILDEGDDED
jgi:hypothetical protein